MGKFVSDTKEILEVIGEAEAKGPKGKSKQTRTTRAVTPEIESEQE